MLLQPLGFMEENYSIPDLSETKYTQANNDDTFLYSILEYPLATSAAISRIKRYFKLKDGILSWKEAVR